MNWHKAAPVGRGARIAQLAILTLVSFVTIGVGLGLLFTKGEIVFEITPNELVVEVDPGILAGTRRVPLASIRAVELASVPLGPRYRGTAKPGHCSGWFGRGELGEVWDASTCGAETVVVRLPDETWTLGVADREAFAKALQNSTPGIFAARPASDPPPPWWRALQALTLLLLLLPPLLLAAMLIPLRFAASPGTLHIKSPVGTRRFDLAGAEARVVDHPKIGLRLFGMGFPGAWLGLFRIDGKTTHLWASRRKGPIVLVEGPKRVMVNPEDPEALLADLRAAGAR